MRVTVTATEAGSGMAGETAATARSVAYALFSQLLVSPWDDGDPRAALPPSDLESILNQLTVSLPAAIDFGPLAGAATAVTAREVDDTAQAGTSQPCEEGGTTAQGTVAEELARIYSGLFEVGSDGPPVPLREGLVDGRPSSTREEIVRFYEFFGFDLEADRQWQPDHLSVELEFVHFLAFREAAAAGGSESDRAQHLDRALRLGQLDFLDRHLLAWVPATADRLAARVAGEPPKAGDATSRRGEPATAYYAAVLRALVDFLAADAEWQRARVSRES